MASGWPVRWTTRRALAGVPVLRRASGGGAVYHDLGNLNVTIAVPGYAPRLAGELAVLIAVVIQRFGLKPSIGERGVFIGQVKVSGLAAHVTRAGSLAHATLLVTTPAALVHAYLAPAPADTHPLDSRRAPVGPLSDYDPEVDISVTCAAVLAVMAARSGGLSLRRARTAERRWCERLLRERYRDPAWHLTGRPKEAPWTTRPVSICTQ